MKGNLNSTGSSFLFFFTALLFNFYSLEALPTVVPDPIPCIEYLETNFFEPRIVAQSLSLRQVKQEMWLPITHALQSNSINVPQRMKLKTAFMVPNPLEFPVNKPLVAQILKQALYEVFMDTMRFYNTNEQPQADFIFNDIYQRRQSFWNACFLNGYYSRLSFK